MLLFVLLLVGSVVVRAWRKPSADLPSVFTVCLVVSYILLVVRNGATAYVIPPLFVGWVCDIVFIASTRWVLRWCGNMDRIVGIVSMIAVNIAIGLALYGVPLLLSGPVFVPLVSTQFGFEMSTFSYERGALCSVLAASNLVDVWVSCAIVLLGIGLMAHRLLWPIVNRPLYAIATRTGARRGLFVFLGLALWTLSAGKVPEIWKWILNALAGP